jgi:hypothetical protein
MNGVNGSSSSLSSIYQSGQEPGTGTVKLVPHIQQMIDTAERVANEIAPPKQSSAACEDRHHTYLPSYHCCHSHWYTPWYWPSNHTTVIVERPKSARERKEEANNQLAIVLGIVALVGSYFFGKHYGLHSEAVEQETRVSEEWRQVSQYRSGGDPRVGDIQNIVLKELAVLSMVRRDARDSLINTTVTLAGAIFGLAGFFVEAPAVLAVGSVTVLASGCVALGRWGFSTTDRELKKMATGLQNDVAKLKSGLQDANASRAAAAA